MTTDILKAYRAQSKSLKDTVELMESNSDLFPAECVKTYKEVACNPIYCSEDEEKFISEYDLEDCDQLVDQW